MRVTRHFTTDGKSPYDSIAFRTTNSEIRNPDGSIVFQLQGIQAPEAWSQVACDVLAQKYFRKAGVPVLLKPVVEDEVPAWLWKQTADDDALALIAPSKRFGPETDARQVFDRLAGTWTYWGWKGGYFDAEADARAFFDELRYMLAMQMCAPTARNGSTPDCSGPMASMARLRGTTMSTTPPAKCIPRPARMNGRSRMPVLSRALPMIW